ncbi:MAG: TrkA C-terminal domain-containing protein [Phycisphaeraceae bacterium]|nr:TrkA C-terminal domain-containing protein [Phycisphaerales bacterium]MCB9861122.1 TrkA C-terminal domain-containing protein [Phycisphaeraceae bacterium]
MTGAIPALLVIATVAFVIVRVGARALMKTGLSETVANFQASSAFFGVGFTTRESELALANPARRRIILHLIIAGNVGLTTTLTTLVIAFLGRSSEMSAATKIAIILGGSVVFFLVVRSKLVNRGLDAFINITLDRFHVTETPDYEMLIRTHSGFEIGELTVEPESPLVQRSLFELGLGRRGVVVLGVTRENGEYIGVPVGDTRLRSGDTMLVYGLERDLQQTRGAKSLEDLPPVVGSSNLKLTPEDALEHHESNPGHIESPAQGSEHAS